MSKLCQIHHVKNSFDQKTLLLIISALVIIKLLHYSTTVWANTRAPKIVKKLQAIQNFVCKIVTNTSQPYVNLTWLALKKQLEYRDTVMTYKCLITSRPPVWVINLSGDDQSPSHSQQRPPNITYQPLFRPPTTFLYNIPLFRTASGQRKFHYRAVKIWNNLDWAQEGAVPRNF